MNPHYTYLAINLLSVLFPLLLSFDQKVAFWRQCRYLLWGLIPTGLFFVLWDVLFTRWGVWGFNDQYTAGVKALGLPLEEWMFFLAVPYSCVFIYECLLRYIDFSRYKDRGWNILLAVGILSGLLGCLFWNRSYTFYAFFGSGVSLCIAYWFRDRLGSFRADAFLIMYGLSIIPFLIVNGVLTSLPVVIYNDSENLGIRIYTIPVEDLFYGMMLMLGNVAGMEWARSGKVGK